jgi:hypothetical protein
MENKQNCVICLRGCIDKIKSGHFETIESIYSGNKYINIYAVYNSIKKHIIDVNSKYNFDFIIHCWNPDMEKKMCELYKPKASLFESQIYYKNVVKCSMDGQKLGITKTLKLMENYCNTNNITYDKVIVYRPDVLLFKDLNLDLYKNDNLYCNSNEYQDFHFIMNYQNALRFKNISQYNDLNFYQYVKQVLKKQLIGDDIKCGIHQEVLRKLKFSSISRHNIKRELFYNYGLNDKEIDLLTHN